MGINLNPGKECNFDCIYCQVDRTIPPATRKVDLSRLAAEVDLLAGDRHLGDRRNRRVEARHRDWLKNHVRRIVHGLPRPTVEALLDQDQRGSLSEFILRHARRKGVAAAQLGTIERQRRVIDHIVEVFERPYERDEKLIVYDRPLTADEARTLLFWPGPDGQAFRRLATDPSYRAIMTFSLGVTSERVGCRINDGFLSVRLVVRG